MKIFFKKSFACALAGMLLCSTFVQAAKSEKKNQDDMSYQQVIVDYRTQVKESQKQVRYTAQEKVDSLKQQIQVLEEQRKKENSDFVEQMQELGKKQGGQKQHILAQKKVMNETILAEKKRLRDEAKRIQKSKKEELEAIKMERKEKFQQYLEQKKFAKKKKKTKDQDEEIEILVGEEDIDMSITEGIIDMPILLESTTKDPKAEVFIPANTYMVTAEGTEYQGILENPEVLDNEVASELGEPISVIHVGDPTGESIIFKNQFNAPQQVKVKMPIYDRLPGDQVIIQTSQDGINWSFHAFSTVQIFAGEIYVEFFTDHFSHFATLPGDGNEVTMVFTGDTIGSGVFYENCYMPVDIRVGGAGRETNGIDTKFFLGDYFQLQDDNTNFTGIILGDFETYQSFHAGAEMSEYLGTGDAIAGPHTAEEYLYINGTSSRGNHESGNIYIATVYMKPNMAYASGNLDFYFLGTGVDGDDSTFSSGYNTDDNGFYTQYTDALWYVEGTGNYIFTGDYACPYKPYITAATYTSTLGAPLGIANNFENGDGFEVQAPHDGGNFFGDIVMTAGPDFDETIDYASSGSWEVWTSGAVVIDITTNEPTRIPLSGNYLGDEYTKDVGQLIQNYDFSAGATYWQPGGSSAPSGTVTAGVMRVEATQAGSMVLSSTQSTIKKGRTYRARINIIDHNFGGIPFWALVASPSTIVDSDLDLGINEFEFVADKDGYISIGYLGPSFSAGNYFEVDYIDVQEIDPFPVYEGTAISVTSPDQYATNHQITVSDNTTTGYVTLYNGIRNYGDTYATGGDNYTEKFSIDVRWIDTTAPVVGTSSVVDLGSEVVTLTATETGFADRTSDDDKFRIVLFSGTNTQDYSYPSDPQGYSADLNATYTSTTNQNFAMAHDITFTETRAGDIYVADIAGNITIIPVSVDVTPQVQFVVKAIPAYRNAVGDYSSTGHFWVFENDGGRQTLHNSYLAPASYSGLDLGAGGTGRANIAVPANGNQFMIVYKAEGMLAVGVTGTWTRDVTDTANNIIDFSSGGSLVSLLGAADGSLYPAFANDGVNYLYQGDVDATGNRYELIDNFDLTAIELRLTTDTVSNLGQYDFDLNNAVNIIEQAVELQSDTTYGFIGNYASQGTNPLQTDFVDFSF